MSPRGVCAGPRWEHLCIFKSPSGKAGGRERRGGRGDCWVIQERKDGGRDQTGTGDLEMGGQGVC